MSEKSFNILGFSVSEQQKYQKIDPRSKKSENGSKMLENSYEAILPKYL